MKSFFWGLQNISLYSSNSPLGLVLKHTHRLGSSEAKEKQKSICPFSSSENCQVVAGLWLLPERHLLVLARDHAAQEALGLLADALPAPAVGHAPRVVLLAVFPQADLSDDALEQILHVVVKGRGCLDELAVKYHSTGASLCKDSRRGEPDISTVVNVRTWTISPGSKRQLRVSVVLGRTPNWLQSLVQHGPALN